MAEGTTPSDAHSRAPVARSTEGEIDEDRPDLFSEARKKLRLLERFNIWWCRKSTIWRWADWLCAWFQRRPGALWVHLGSRHLRREVGLDRLPPMKGLKNFIVVANHRSYFDLFLISMVLFRHGLRRRMLFPVRANFFYTHPLGFFVNGVMSFWSMYPPLFRDRKRASLNRTALSELSWSLLNTRVGVGLHPEGTRNKGEDPYKLLRAQSGVGRVIHETRATVIPVFINGLSNSFWGQLGRNRRKDGPPVFVVFGKPVDFGDLLDQPSEHRLHKAISQRTLDVITELGEEEQRLRAEAEAGGAPPLTVP